MMGRFALGLGLAVWPLLLGLLVLAPLAFVFWPIFLVVLGLLALAILAVGGWLLVRAALGALRALGFVGGSVLVPAFGFAGRGAGHALRLAASGSLSVIGIGVRGAARARFARAGHAVGSQKYEAQAPTTLKEIEALVWTEAGFDAKAATRWQRRGFDPLAASAWRNAGFQPAEARVWRADGFSAGRGREWRERGLRPRNGLEWRPGASPFNRSAPSRSNLIEMARA